MQRILFLTCFTVIASLAGCSNAPEPSAPVPVANRFTVNGSLYPETVVEVSKAPVPLNVNTSLGIQQVTLSGIINDIDTMNLTLSWDGVEPGSYPWSGSKNSPRYIRMVIRTKDGRRIDMQPEPTAPVGETIVEGADDQFVYGRFYGNLRGGGASLNITHGYFRSIRP
jgi:hypothetical protein